jgi:tetratricopeptide (TPR) repeat protein/predicted Ser/Thr protein kinase
MPSHQWQKVQEIFGAAADLAAEEQRRLLDSACGLDSALRQEVESLLVADRAGGERITAALEDAAQSLLGADPMLGARLGPWRVVREIGRGGMGSVYLATRDDEQFQQQAAIKLVRYGLDTAELLDRFRRERQILANLDHPYIARLVDGGSTPEGRPFLVMEYVEGQSIGGWLRDRGPSVEERCRLFLKVCEAVAYAHRNLVVHRDLKPGNILITAGDSPKLLDFGVAKLLTPENDPNLTATALAERPFTPEYASPEQVLGKPVTTATDVYSLGAVLYELLTGSKAHRISSSATAEVERAVCRAPITRPSQAVPESLPGAARLRRQLAGDLDTIILMAMRKEPERRYSSVDEFAADVRRYLEGLPVAARKESLGYRAGKFVRRHRLGLGAAVLSFISLLLGTAMAVSQARQAESARRVAESQRRAAEQARRSAESEHAAADRQRDAALTARALAESEARQAQTETERAQRRLTEMLALANHSLFDVHAQIERLPGATEARQQIVKTTLQYLEELAKDAGNDERLRMAVAAGYLRLGQVQGDPYGASLRDYPAALKSYRAAENLLAPLVRAHPNDADALMAWVDVKRGMGMVLESSGNGAEGVTCMESALGEAATLARLRPNDFEAVRRESLLYDSLTEAISDLDTAAALPWARKHLAASTALAARFPDREEAIEELSDAHSFSGKLLLRLGDPKGARAEYEQSALLRERLFAAHPNDVVHRRSLMLAYGHLAAVLGDPFGPNLGDFEGARTYYGKAVAIAEGTAAADPQNRTAQYDVAAATLRLGAVDVPASGLSASLEALRKAAAIVQSLSVASPSDLHLKRDWEIAEEYIGHRLRDLGKLPEAIAAYRRSLESANSTLADNPADLVASAQATASGGALAAALAMSGDRAGALAQARQMTERAEARVSIKSDKNLRILHLARTLVSLGSAYRILATAASASTAQSEADWREARASAARALSEIGAIPGSDQNGNCSQAIKEARALIADADAHLPAAK